MTTPEKPAKTRYVMRNIKSAPGVYRRCAETCTDDCRKHRYGFSVDLGTGPDGKRQQITRSGFETLKAAKAARDEIVSKHRSGTLPVNRKLTVGEHLKTWIDTKVQNGLRPSTARGYRSHIDELTPRIGHIRLAELRPHHLNQTYADIRSERGVSASTIRGFNATVRSALASALRAGEVDRNVATLTELPSVNTKRVKVWTPAEYAAFLDKSKADDDPYWIVWLLAGFSGLRRGELLALRWSDVDFEAGFITVRHSITQVGNELVHGRPKTRSGEDRRVPMIPEVIEALKAHRRQQVRSLSPDALVLPGIDGEPMLPQSVSRRFKRTVTKYGLPVMKLHGLRHLAASLMISAGVPIEVVSKILGHSSVQITSATYSHFMDVAGQDAAAKVTALMSKARGQG